MRMENEESELGKLKVVKWICWFGLIGGLLGVTGCASSSIKTEIPFGTEAAVDPFIVSTEKTGEGEFLIILTSSAAEELSVDVRMWRTKIGYDYSGKYTTKSNPYIDAKFLVDGGRTTISSGGTKELSVRLTNRYHISRYFKTKASIYIKGADTKWHIDIPIMDSELFTDIEFLRQLNKTNYWHPSMLDKNWSSYLEHIGE